MAAISHERDAIQVTPAGPQEPSPWDIAKAEFACDHTETRPRYKTAKNGVKMYKRQCLNCGDAIGEWISRSKVENIEDCLPFDEDLYNRWQSYIHNRVVEISQERAKPLAERESDWKDWYDDYLQSDVWHDKSERVLKRDGYVCQACLRRTATQAHHLTYKHVGKEPLFDLVAVCNLCHDALHKSEADHE